MDDHFSHKTTEVMVTTEDVGHGSENIDMVTIGHSESSAAVPQTSQTAGVYSVTISSEVRSDRNSRPEFTKATQGSAQIRAPPTTRPSYTQRGTAFENNTAAWSYARCAILFFTAILVTWLPSSANRVYSVVHPGYASVPLQFMSAIVLPLQGFWNAVIYVSTSWSACKYFFSEMKERTKNSEHTTSKFAGDFTGRNSGFKIPSRRARHNYETESMTELAISTRPNSNEEPQQQRVQ